MSGRAEYGADVIRKIAPFLRTWTLRTGNVTIGAELVADEDVRIGEPETGTEPRPHVRMHPFDVVAVQEAVADRDARTTARPG